MKIFLFVILLAMIFLPVYAADNSQILPTEKKTLNVEFATEPTDLKGGDSAKLLISFINPTTKKIQEHVDYIVEVTKDGKNIFGPTQLIHTSEGSIKIPVEFPENGDYKIKIDIQGILFQPIPKESVIFDIGIGTASAQPPEDDGKKENGGGCLIATAAYDSEISSQIQNLREIRDNIVMQTQSGAAFMTTFNQIYYSFSPSVADIERENPNFKDFVKISIQPMMATFSILKHVSIESEEQMIGYGTGVILINLGIYIGLPVFGFFALRTIKK